jgi:hypothetical protein
VRRLALLLVASCGRVAFDPFVGTTGDGNSALDASSECPADFVRAGTSCYRVNHFQDTGDGNAFVASEALCEAQGGHLLVIDDAAEWTRVSALGLLGTDYWIGVSELAQLGVYRTVLDDVATYLPWDTSEPDSGVDHCVGVRVATGNLYDNVCTGLDDSICEYDGRQPVPAAWGQ